jgi:hypothetical protein
MTFPVQIELGNHAISTHLHALPRPGDHIHCAFPSAGIPKLFLVVKEVWFHQLSDFEGKECREPFRTVVTTDGDPAHAEHNDAVFKKLVSGKG